MSVDLRNCKPGDKLLTRSGEVFTYVTTRDNADWPHIIESPNVKGCTRTNEGLVFSNKVSHRSDIVEILPQDPPDKSTVTLPVYNPDKSYSKEELTNLLQTWADALNDFPENHGVFFVRECFGKLVLVDRDGPNTVTVGLPYKQPVEAPAKGVVVVNKSGFKYFSQGKFNEGGRLVCKDSYKCLIPLDAWQVLDNPDHRSDNWKE